MKLLINSRVVWLSAVVLATVGFVVVILTPRRRPDRGPRSLEAEALWKTGTRALYDDNGDIFEAQEVGSEAFPYLQNEDRLRILLLREGCPGDSLRYIRDLPMIENADFRRATVADRDLQYIVGWRRLYALDLSGAAITDDGMQQLSSLPALSELYLVDTSVTDAGLEAIGRIKNLRRLNLKGSPIAGHGLRHLARLDVLRDLDLTRTRITDASLAGLSGCVHLMYLTLAGTQIHGPGLASLTGLPKLKSLSLRETNVPYEAASVLIAANPNLTISWGQ